MNFRALNAPKKCSDWITKPKKNKGFEFSRSKWLLNMIIWVFAKIALNFRALNVRLKIKKRLLNFYATLESLIAEHSE